MQENNMNITNIEDYYISVEHLNNFTDNNINNWIESGNKEKILNKLDQIYKTGRSFTSNGYQATSTDAVFTPFCFEKNGKLVIEYLEARHVFYFPALLDPVKPILPKEEKNPKKRKLPVDNKEPIKTEIKSPEKKKRKIIQNSNDVNHSEELSKIEAVKKEFKSPEPKNMKSNNTIDLDNRNVTEESVNKTENNNIDSKKMKCNGSIDLDNTDENKDNVILKPKKHKKKSKKSVDGEEVNEKSIPQTEPVKINGENEISNGNVIQEKKKKKKKSTASNELTEVKEEKIVAESPVNNDNLPKSDVSEEVTKQKKHKKRKHSEEVVVEVKKEKSHKKSKKHRKTDN